MTLKQLEYLIKTVECGSLTAAAQALEISQPSLTKALNNLEEEYHVQLLRRQVRGVELTEQGRDFVSYARSVLTAVQTLEQNAASRAAPPMRLSLAVQQLDFIYPLVHAFYVSAEDQKMFLDLVETDRYNVVRQVADGASDIGIAVRTGADIRDFLWSGAADRLEVHVLQTGGCYAAVGPMSPFYQKKSIHISETANCLHAGLDMEPRAKQALWADGRLYGHFNHEKIVFFNTAAATAYFLSNTDAISFTSAWTSGCYSGTSIRVIPVVGEDFHQELIWFKRRGEPLGPAGVRFMDLVYRYFSLPIPNGYGVSNERTEII